MVKSDIHDKSLFISVHKTDFALSKSIAKFCLQQSGAVKSVLRDVSSGNYIHLPLV